MARAEFDLPANTVLYRMFVANTEFNVTAFEVDEALNSPGLLRANLIAFDPSIDLQGKLGQQARLEIDFGHRDDVKTRYFHGIVNRFSLAGTDTKAAYYELDIVPSIWLMSLKFRSRVHVTDRSQSLTVKEVVSQILKENGLQGRFEFKLSRSYEPYSFLTQYNQSDLEFVTYLCELEGLTYFVDQRKDQDHYIFTDDTTTLDPASPYDEILARRSSGALADQYESIEQMTCRHQLSFGKAEFRNYDFKDSQRRLNDNNKGISDEKYEYYYYGEGFQDQEGSKERMKRLAQNRTDEFNAGVVEASGRGNYRCLTAGRLFTVTEADSTMLNKKWLCTSIKYQGTQEAQVDEDGAPMGMGGADYHMSFSCIPSNVPFRPVRTISRPTIQGAQTAIVTGPSGQEIYTDKFGRVKVQLHWDRQPKSDINASNNAPNYDDKSSFWCRVAQTAAGKGWGVFSLPRVGQEVLIDFVGGNPDQPVVVGVMHNDYQTPPYTLPDHQTRTTIKTNSTPGGNGFNEVRFEDKKGSEQIFMHAERNMDIRVKASCMEAIGASRHLIVGNEKDGGDQKERVFGNVDLEVYKNQVEKVRQDYQLSVLQNFDFNIDKSHTLYVGGDSNISVTGAHREGIGGKYSLGVHADRHTTVAGNDLLGVTGSCHVKANDIVLSATNSLTLAVGSNFVKIDASGVTIMGTMVKLNSGGAAGVPKTAAPEEPGACILADPKEPAAADDDKTGEKSMLPQPPQ